MPQHQVWLNTQHTSAPGTPPINGLLVDHLHELPKSWLIIGSTCIPKLAWSLPQSAARIWLDHGLQVNHFVLLISAIKCIFKLTWLQPPCSHTQARDSANPISHSHDLHLNLETHSIMASKCISDLAWLNHPRASLSFLDRHIQVHLELCSCSAGSQSRYTVYRWKDI